ncbi:Uma2 family endonuclease [candidate division KSB1 bacterium]|nr:Uma2 family endonuclease [candidate division KSB1 bacterium]
MATTLARGIRPLDAYSGESPFEEEYLPDSDGKPMAETDRHRKVMISLLYALAERYHDQARVYVSGNIFVYYLDEAGVRQSVSPDILVVFGVEKKDRRIYKVDEEGKGPDIVIELTSSSTKVEDLVAKHYIYANMGVREYFLFDPYGETKHPMLRGFRLEGGEYVPMVGTTRLSSEVLGLELRVEQGELRLYDIETGERLRTPEEAEAERRAEKAARLAAEEKAAQEKAKAAQAKAQAAQAEAKAAQELAARQAAEADLARLREELAALRGKQP